MAGAEPDIPSHYAAALKVLEDLNPKPVIALDLDYTVSPLHFAVCGFRFRYSRFFTYVDAALA